MRLPRIAGRSEHVADQLHKRFSLWHGGDHAHAQPGGFRENDGFQAHIPSVAQPVKPGLCRTRASGRPFGLDDWASGRNFRKKFQCINGKHPPRREKARMRNCFLPWSGKRCHRPGNRTRRGSRARASVVLARSALSRQPSNPFPSDRRGRPHAACKAPRRFNNSASGIVNSGCESTTGPCPPPSD